MFDGFTHLLKNFTHKSQYHALTQDTVSARFLKTGCISEKCNAIKSSVSDRIFNYYQTAVNLTSTDIYDSR